MAAGAFPNAGGEPLQRAGVWQPNLVPNRWPDGLADHLVQAVGPILCRSYQPD